MLLRVLPDSHLVTANIRKVEERRKVPGVINVSQLRRNVSETRVLILTLKF